VTFSGFVSSIWIMNRSDRRGRDLDVELFDGAGRIPGLTAKSNRTAMPVFLPGTMIRGRAFWRVIVRDAELEIGFKPSRARRRVDLCDDPIDAAQLFSDTATSG
jgi:hypothetical protein